MDMLDCVADQLGVAQDPVHRINRGWLSGRDGLQARRQQLP